MHIFRTHFYKNTTGGLLLKSYLQNIGFIYNYFCIYINITCQPYFIIYLYLSPSKILKFHLIFWFGVFAETHSALSSRTVETVVRSCSVKKAFLKISQNSQENTCDRVSFLIKERVSFLSKKRLWHRCFPANFANFLRTPYLQNTSAQLLLNVIYRS